MAGRRKCHSLSDSMETRSLRRQDTAAFLLSTRHGCSSVCSKHVSRRVRGRFCLIEQQCILLVTRLTLQILVTGPSSEFRKGVIRTYTISRGILAYFPSQLNNVISRGGFGTNPRTPMKTGMSYRIVSSRHAVHDHVGLCERVLVSQSGNHIK